MEQSTLITEADVEVRTFVHLTFEDLTPLLTTLNSHFLTVKTTRHAFEPPMAGGPDVGLTMAIATLGAGSVVFLKGFLEEMGKDTYQTLRRRLLALFRRSRQSDSGRTYVPFALEIGQHRFHFESGSSSESEMSEADLLERLRQADEYVRTHPEELLIGVPGPPEQGLFWNEQTRKWTNLS